LSRKQYQKHLYDAILCGVFSSGEHFDATLH